PDAWKDPQYVHPVLRTAGLGRACMLVVDAADRRGNERVWVSVADSIGATHRSKWGAHNGWHAVGNTDEPANSINDPANNRTPDTGIPAGSQPEGRHAFVAQHGGQAGTTWDLYQVRASDVPVLAAGSIGSRLGFHVPGDPQQEERRSRLGPTLEMMTAYYNSLVLLTGDLHTDILGPSRWYSQNDIGLI